MNDKNLHHVITCTVIHHQQNVILPLIFRLQSQECQVKEGRNMFSTKYVLYFCILWMEVACNRECTHQVGLSSADFYCCEKIESSSILME